MKQANHNGNELSVDGNMRTVVGNRQRLIPETNTDKALLIHRIDDASRREERDKDGETRLWNLEMPILDPSHWHQTPLNDDPGPGWFGVRFSVTPMSNAPFPSLNLGEYVYGACCVVEHPHRDLDHHAHLEVWCHFPKQDGCLAHSHPARRSWPITSFPENWETA